MTENKATLRWRQSCERNNAIILAAKDVPCADCGNRYPAVCMDFDHRDPDTKMGTISRMRTATLARLTEEIDKCDIVCANCHRIRSAELFGSRPDREFVTRRNRVAG